MSDMRLRLRPPPLFACAFLTLAALYGAGFFASVQTNARAAESRFEALRTGGFPGLAYGHGERALKLRLEEGASAEDLSEFKTKVAKAAIASKRFGRGATLYAEALNSEWGKSLDALDRAIIEDRIARAKLMTGDIAGAAKIYAEFLERAGDEASRAEPLNEESGEAHFARLIASAATPFTEALKPQGDPDKIDGSRDARLIAAADMTDLGAFFALRQDGLYAAAGLVASAHAVRREVLGQQDAATTQAALILGPVYVQLDRLADAEQLYLDVFHAQEKVKGPNSPELSLYIKLLSDIYEKQGRATEAQALNEHMRAIFRDAFGAQRYAANRIRDRKLDIDRPVSQQFVLRADYAPTDLVGAAAYSVPLSKNADLDEMKLRRAADLDDDADPQEANLPARLAQLISLCRSESGERLSLRSGYRAYATQKELFARNAGKGTVTPPGMSEHQTGLAADIDVDGRMMRQSDRAYQCFEENAFRFGFILSYPPGNNYLPAEDTYEPWHWRYVGIRTAQLYREVGPADRPQEFLAALPCYQELAMASGPAGDGDACLQDAKVIASAADAPKKPAAAENPAARKLNNLGQSGQR
jgi:LAS superfamily LD-carboxypeptidase LdcB